MDQMREEVANLYNGPKWKQRVHRMSEKQIYAIFMKETEKGRLLAAQHRKKLEDEAEELLRTVRPAPEQLLLDLGIRRER